MTTEAKPKGLAAKMAAAMAGIGRVKKRGMNQAQGYKYARADDVAEQAREILAQHGIAIYPDVLEYGVREVEAKNGKIRITWAKVAWTFVDSETGDTRTVNVPGEGQDSGDKGIYKAVTGSMKYALMATFLIPTGEGDPEHDADEDVPFPQKPAKPAAAEDVKAAAAKQAIEMRERAKDPKVRKAAALRWLTERYGDPKYRIELARVLGRTFPLDAEVTFQNVQELETVEKWITLAKATDQSEARA